MYNVTIQTEALLHNGFIHACAKFHRPSLISSVGTDFVHKRFDTPSYWKITEYTLIAYKNVLELNSRNVDCKIKIPHHDRPTSFSGNSYWEINGTNVSSLLKVAIS